MNVKDISFELIDIDGLFCIYTEEKIDRNMAPAGCYVYELKKSKKNRFYQITEAAQNNFGGSVISRIPIYLKSVDQGSKVREITSCEFLGVHSTVYSYLNNTGHRR